MEWEQVPNCGGCSSGRYRFAGAIGKRRYAVCLDCHVERLFDRVAEARLDLLYASYYADHEMSPAGLERQLANPTFGLRRERLERACGERPRRILEIGCGDGNFLCVLRRAGWEVEGQEFSAATSAIVEHRHGIRMNTGPLGAIEPGRAFPVVAAYHVFEHIYHPAEWLAQVRELLEAGGLLHLQVPNAGSLARRLSGELWSGLVFPQHVYFYRPRTMRDLLTRSGFSVVSASTWDPWHGPGAVSSTLANIANRITSGRRPWHDDVCATSPGCLPATLPPRTALPVRALLRTGLDGTAAVLARVEAAAACGAVVDVIARRN